MWFKNLRIYHLKNDLEISQETLEAQLKSFAFTPCTSEQTETAGLVPPLGSRTEALYHVCDGKFLFRARFEKKLLPASVVKDFCEERIEQFTDEKGRAPKGKEKTEIRDAVMLFLLPKAFAVHSDTCAWIDPANRLVLVDASSAAKAEAVLSLVRKALGTLPLEPLKVNSTMSAVMTKWLLRNTVPGRLELGDQISMYSTQNEKKVVSARSDDLLEDEIIQHLKQDKIVSKIALKYDESVSFTLDEEFAIKKIKFELKDDDQDGAGDEKEQDPAAQENADIFTQFATFSQMVPYLIKEFGGLAQS